MILNTSDINSLTVLSEGGESIIYEHKKTVFKIYKDIVNKPEKEIKLKKISSLSLPNNIVKPLSLIYNQKNEFIGYSMNKIAGTPMKQLTSKKFINVQNITIKDICKILIETKNTLEILHKQNIIIGDLNYNNIIFTDSFIPYFIDIDSWSIDNINCSVAMDSFKDPLLIKNNFNTFTDFFSFAVLIFNSLTRLHPFGGTTSPNMDIPKRMIKKISVFNNKQVVVPKNIGNWNFISPSLLKDLETIFESDSRFLISTSLDDFYNNLTYCNIHKNYYYSKYAECPICSKNVKLKSSKLKDSSDVPFNLIFTEKNIKSILSLNSFIDNNNNIVHIDKKVSVPFDKYTKTLFSEDGNIIYNMNGFDLQIYINKIKKFSFSKQYNSDVIIKNNSCYYINPRSTLVELTVLPQGNSVANIAKTSINALFNIFNKSRYFICNIYDNNKILNVNGKNLILNNNDRIENYGIHFDTATNNWLFIFEDRKGLFHTFVLKDNKIIYENHNIRYNTTLSNLCFSNNIIYIPLDGKIKGFNFEKDISKNFPCNIINEDSKLKKESSYFIVMNEKEIYKVG